MNFIRCISLIVIFLFSLTSDAQSFIFGPKVGPLVGVQQWDGVQRGPLVAGHVAVFIESYREDDPSSLYAQIGLHQRGSAERDLVINRSIGDLVRQNLSYKFSNISLQLGAKRLLKMESKAKPFYTMGIRAEYTVKTNLDQFDNSQFAAYFPNNAFVNKFNYGISGGGGFQYQFGDLVGGTVELTISPDISKQYERPPVPNVINPRNVGSSITLRQQEVRNISLEIGVSLRLLRKVEYY